MVTCTEQDVPGHIDRLRPVYAKYNADIAVQTEAAYTAVKEHTAHKLIGEDRLYGFTYLMKHRIQEYIARVVWFRSKSSLATFLYLGRLLKIRFIHLYPHTNIVPYQFLFEEHTLRTFHALHTPLSINLFSHQITSFINKYFTCRNGALDGWW